jgi:hypothetical protein
MAFRTPNSNKISVNTNIRGTVSDILLFRLISYMPA